MPFVNRNFTLFYTEIVGNEKMMILKYNQLTHHCTMTLTSFHATQLHYSGPPIQSENNRLSINTIHGKEAIVISFFFHLVSYFSFVAKG